MLKSNSVIVLCLLLLSFGLPAQDSVAYSKDFVFKEGIYLSYKQFKSNSPVGIKQILSDYDKTRLDFLSSITSKKEIIYLDADNNKVTVKSSDLWGYCQNQAIYIGHNDDFFRVSVLGNIFHFLGYQNVTVAFNNPSFYGYQQYPATVKEQTQFIFDNQNQKVLLFSVFNMEDLLMRDEVLYKEFMALNNRKKRQSIFLYLRKYNEKHPLYLY